MSLTEAAAAYLQPHLNAGDGDVISSYGTLLLAGSMATARAEDRATTRGYLAEADEAARRLGVDGITFGPHLAPQTSQFTA